MIPLKMTVLLQKSSFWQNFTESSYQLEVNVTKHINNRTYKHGFSTNDEYQNIPVMGMLFG